MSSSGGLHRKCSQCKWLYGCHCVKNWMTSTSHPMTHLIAVDTCGLDHLISAFPFPTLRSGNTVLPVVHRRPVTARDPRERTHVRRTAELARTVAAWCTVTAREFSREMVRELPLTCMQPCMVCLTAREFSREMVRKNSRSHECDRARVLP